MLAALLIFLGTYLVLAIGRLPGFRVDRTGSAIIGATLMVAFNVLTLQEATAAINWDTILLLFGMMIVVANLRLSGFFALVTEWVVEHAHRPLVLLASIVVVSGVFSAFFVNDTMCLALTPLVLDITTQLRRKPVPYLLAIAMASNIGSVATITGNPQNMLIGSFSGIQYRDFLLHLGPVAVVGLLLDWLLIHALCARAGTRDPVTDLPDPVEAVDRSRLVKPGIVMLMVMAGFLAGLPPALVAAFGAAVMLITRSRE